MTTEEAKKQVKDLIDRLEASSVNLLKRAPGISQEREKDAKALKLLLADEINSVSDECPLCGV